MLLDIDRSQIYRIYANEKVFSDLLFFAYQNKDSEDIPFSQSAKRFINMVLLLLVNKYSFI
jgi:hypothetical protein